MVKVKSHSACVVHGHVKHGKKDKPKGTPIKCYGFSKYGRKGAIKKAWAMHYAITQSQKGEGMKRLSEALATAKSATIPYYAALQDIRRDLTDISSKVSHIASRANDAGIKKIAKSVEQKLDAIRQELFDLPEAQ